MSIKNQKNFYSGILFCLLGVFFVVVAQENELGSASQMGPAYFPTLLGSMLAGMGVLIAVLALFTRPDSGDGKVEKFNWKILTLILGSVLVFTILLSSLGLMLSIAAMIVVAVLADRNIHWKETIAIIVTLDILVWLAFVYGIGMIIPVWPTFF